MGTSPVSSARQCYSASAVIRLWSDWIWAGVDGPSINRWVIRGVLAGRAALIPPPTTMLGGLYRYLREADPKHFQPMNANFGLLDPLEGGPAEGRKGGRISTERKKELLAGRALAELRSWMSGL